MNKTIKTIKIIDLLSKIANGEEVPEKIKYYGHEWKLLNEKYYHNGTELFEEYLENSIIRSLNNEVEIIEDEDINIQDIEEYGEYQGVNTLIDQINKLLKAVKKLDKEINK